ncbi:putative thiazole biosynthetic enzyme [Caloramator mitchellensis]|uniref:Putative thiazole biosynthetic enzyme n=1 Tax=Caloramator mitchellensis TaxID=908809 RepID=A0A0R3JUJ0_CALMK|nr:hypothetical protein [Caloramator mitchellensis]KRQ87176.1 putative thiazole biosynthetic enzyme [Caloramator mitchellensis]
MPVKVNNIRLSIDENIDILKNKAANIAKIKTGEIKNFKIIKESVDARRKGKIDFVYQVEFETDNDLQVVIKAKNKDVVLEDIQESLTIEYGKEKLNYRPVIIGTGPAGLFAGLVLAKNGYKPIIFERGAKVEDRDLHVKKFWEERNLNTESNIQFGEGGAGTYSDGKLTTRIKDKRCDFVLDEFVNCGAPEEIKFVSKPHIGTDILKIVVKNIRNKIIELGGEVHFNSKLTDINIKDGKIKSIVINDSTEIPVETVVLAIGHSARDTYEMMFNKGILISQKPFAIGVRIEHPQWMIDVNQYGKFAGHPRLKAADYRLTYTTKMGRPVYSFCMCPGGVVVAAASEENSVVTNGMSEFARDKENANSAIVVGINTSDFGSEHPLAGVEFQRKYEQLAFKVAGGNYNAPIQLVGDLFKDKRTTKLGEVNPSYPIGYEFVNLRECLPSFVVDSIKEALYDFDKKITNFARFDAILTGVETRTSSPIRIERNEDLESSNVTGLYPAGEGAGYAGGIISAAVDGIKVAEKIMQKYKPYER